MHEPIIAMIIANFDNHGLIEYMSKNPNDKTKSCMSFCKYHPQPIHCVYPLLTKLSTKNIALHMLPQYFTVS